MDGQSQGRRAEQVQLMKGAHRSGLWALLFTDMVDSTAIKQQLGDRGAAEFFDRHHAILRETLAHFPQGQEIERAGDSFLLVFATPSDAVQFALMVHARLRSLFDQSKAAGLDRIGIHVGEVLIEADGDGRKPRELFGIQVDTCARVMSLAKAGQVLMTRAVFDSARQVLKGADIAGVGPLEWLNHGLYLLKGLDDAVEVCQVREQGRPDGGPPTSSDKAKRQVRPDEEPVLGWRPALGETIPNTRWVLERKLGEGGFGEVWLARNSTTKQLRVFKFCFQAQRVRYLKRELILFRLLKERVGDHPRIVRINDVYLDQPPFYVEMDYVDGSDLRTWCAAQGGIGSVPLEIRLEVVAQAAEGLQAAHEAGVIHRDVKPANILVSGRPGSADSFSASRRLIPSSSSSQKEITAPAAAQAAPVSVKLTDFGIGQLVSEESLKSITRAELTQTWVDHPSSGTGTQLYMAPELLAGHAASTRSDVYSLGVVLYQLLVEDFARPITSDWTEDITDPLLREDLKRCFARRPEDRFVAVGQLAHHLRSLPERRAHVAKQAAEQAALERAAFRRGMLRTAVSAGVLALVFASLAVVAWRTAMHRRLDLYVSDMGVAWEALQQRQIGRARDLLDRYAHPRVWEKDLRGTEWRLLRDLSRSNFESSTNAGMGGLVGLTFSPDGHWMAAHSAAAIKVWDLRSGQAPRTLAVPNSGLDSKSVAFSPDGQHLAGKAGGQLHVWQTATWQDESVAGPFVPNYNYNDAVAFSPDNRSLSARVVNGLAFLEVGSWRQLLLIPNRPGRGTAGVGTVGTVVVYSPDGQLVAVSDKDELQIRQARDPAKLITTLTRVPAEPEMRVLAAAVSDAFVAATYRDGYIALWNRTNWQQVALRQASDSYLLTLAFSPDGRQLATGGSGHLVDVWDVSTLLSDPAGTRSVQPRFIFRGHRSTVYAAAFTRDGRHLITAGGDGALNSWDVSSSSGQATLRRTIGALGFSADGRIFRAFHDDGDQAHHEVRVHAWDVAQRRDLGPIAGGTNLFGRVAALSADGNWLAFDLADGRVQLRQLPSTAERTLPGDGGRILRLAFSPESGSHHLLVTTLFSDAEGNETRYRLFRLPEASQPLSLVGSRSWRDWSFGDHAAFSPDGKLLALVESEKGLSLFKTDTGESWRMGGDNPAALGSVAFSPDGSLLATTARSGPEVWVREVRTGRLLQTLTTPDDFARSVGFCPDSRTLLTFDGDNIARFWNLPTGREIFRFANRHPMRWGAEFAPGGGAMALTGPRESRTAGEIELYHLPPLGGIEAPER